MASSMVFDWLCEQLEQRSSLDRLESRGTVRLVLKKSGLDVDGLATDQAAVVLRKLMPKELEVRNVTDADAICESMAVEVERLEATGDLSSESPENVFARLGR